MNSITIIIIIIIIFVRVATFFRYRYSLKFLLTINMILNEFSIEHIEFRTLDQAKALLKFVEAISEKTLRYNAHAKFVMEEIKLIILK